MFLLVLTDLLAPEASLSEGVFLVLGAPCPVAVLFRLDPTDGDPEDGRVTFLAAPSLLTSIRRS